MKCNTEIYRIEDEKGLFGPSILLEETDEARGLIFGTHLRWKDCKSGKRKQNPNFISNDKSNKKREVKLLASFVKEYS